MGIGLVGKHVSNSLRLASRHPLLVFMVFVLIWTYRWFPTLFSLLVHASPVIVSTLVLLGTLLFYGHANAPQKEGKPHQHDVQNLVFGGMGSTEMDEGKLGNKKLVQEVKSELGNRKGVLVNRGGQFQAFGSGNGKLSSDGSRRNSFEVLGHIDDDSKGWDTGSDVVEGSSRSSSVADMFPMLDEFHPLLGSDGHLEQGEIVNETDDDVDDDDDHEDMEVRDYDEEEHGMAWTEDDQRNFMNLGSLQHERNQRLESLIARQKAIKNMRILAEKNMVNMSPDLRFIDAHVSTARNTPFDLANQSHENILESAPSNIMPRRNPFDPSLQTNRPLGSRRESSDGRIVGHSTLGSYSVPRRIASDSESTGSRSRFPEDNRSNEVKKSGHADKTFNKSSSSSFFDVPDDINGNDDNGDEDEDFGSIDNSTSDSKDLQESEESDSEEEGGLPQRLKSWLFG